MGQRNMTWEQCRVKDSARCANKSLLSFCTGDGLSVFHSRQLLRFTVTRVSRTHCILYCNRLSTHHLSAAVSSASLWDALMALKDSHLYISKFLSICQCFLKPLYCCHGSLLPIYCVWVTELVNFFPFIQLPKVKSRYQLRLTKPMQSSIIHDPPQMVIHLDTSTWKCWTNNRRVGCLISIGNGKSSSFSSSRSISLKYLLCIHPFICSDNRVHGFFVAFAWQFSGGCTIKARIKARNNYSGLCVGEWQQWKAHCQLCTPAVAWAKDLKAEEVDTEV